VRGRRAVGHLDLDKVLDVERVRAEQPDHLAVGEAELDPVDHAVLIVPLRPMHAEEVAVELEISGGGIVVLRVAQQ
jgi:hypothetical protein